MELRTKLRNYEVETKSETITASEFFQTKKEFYPNGEIKSLHFEHPAACEFVTSLMEFRRGEVVNEMLAAMKTELALEHMKSPGKYPSELQKELDTLQIRGTLRTAAYGAEPFSPFEEFVQQQLEDMINPLATNMESPRLFEKNKTSINFIENDSYGDITKDILTYIENLSLEGVPILMNETVFKFGQQELTIKRAMIGRIEFKPEQEFMVEERIAEKYLFALNVLHKKPPQELQVFEINYFSQDINRHYLPAERSSSKDSYGLAYRDSIYLFPTSHKVTDEIINEDDENITARVHLEIPVKNMPGTLDHEAGHFIDTNLRLATRPQSEGFATAVEHGFVFKKAANRLNRTYSGEMTPALICKILSAEADKLSITETYNVPATFFCWMYEQLGPDNFNNFYDMLTGRFYEDPKSPLDSVVKEIKSIRTPDTQDDVIKCLDRMPRDHNWKWKSSQELLEDYSKQVNSYIT